MSEVSLYANPGYSTKDTPQLKHQLFQRVHTRTATHLRRCTLPCKPTLPFPMRCLLVLCHERSWLGLQLAPSTDQSRAVSPLIPLTVASPELIQPPLPSVHSFTPVSQPLSSAPSTSSMGLQVTCPRPPYICCAKSRCLLRQFCHHFSRSSPCRAQPTHFRSLRSPPCSHNPITTPHGMHPQDHRPRLSQARRIPFCYRLY